ncbi:hypothetical protein FIBSPDRAFT_216037 [Athelia psychrophila]|uniref:Uncharacterized protein n=1 Tax=Athelia psychrophila TaxID=1759441 RepID=A0A166SEF5_9AGAM|nr:hypothetical protein FIBSPDRAFT_216037 [Fibularhizoctonia sp. CBS 109695]
MARANTLYISSSPQVFPATINRDCACLRAALRALARCQSTSVPPLRRGAEARVLISGLMTIRRVSQFIQPKVYNCEHQRLESSAKARTREKAEVSAEARVLAVKGPEVEPRLMPRVCTGYARIRNTSCITSDYGLRPPTIC